VKKRRREWGFLPVVYHHRVKQTADSDICLYHQIDACGIQCPNKLVVKLLITASMAGEVVFRVIAISTIRSYGEPTVQACFTASSNSGVSFHLEISDETSYLHWFLRASRIG
jgi:hypothetical protein